VAQPEYQPERILEVLVRHGVDFVVIGGLAALAHGSPFPTRDVDVTPAKDAANLGRLSGALTELDAKVRPDDEALPFSHDAESLGAAGVWNLTTRFGDLDISMVPDGTEGYQDLVLQAVPTPVIDVVVPVASLADIIRSKQAANRPKDQRVLPTLRELLASRYQNRD
jgi:hypothetical protein